MTKPAAGEIFRYPFLWKREQMAGETESRKARPVCIAVTVAKSDSETVVFILPITTQPPSASRKFIEVPQIESQRVGLETHVRKFCLGLVSLATVPPELSRYRPSENTIPNATVVLSSAVARADTLAKVDAY